MPQKYINRTNGEINLREKYQLPILAILKKEEVETVIGQTETTTKAQGVPSSNYVLKKYDILVPYGSNEDIQQFLKVKLS